MASSYIFDPSQGETPETVKQKRHLADALAARIFGRTPQNLGEGIGSIGQALIAGMMARNANESEAAGRASANDLFSKITGMGGSAPIAAPSASAAASPSIPVEALSASPMQDASAPLSGGLLQAPATTKNPDLNAAIATAASNTGIDPSYLTRVAMLESGGRSDAASPLSSAKGPFQFINSTARQYGLTDPTNVPASAKAAARLTSDNAQALASALGREPTPGELYLAHQQGAGGAIKLLTNPDAPVEVVIGPEAARNNGAKPGMTAGQFAQMWTQKFGGASPMGQQSPFAPPSSSALAFNGEAQNASPLASLPPAAPQGFAQPNDQPNITTLPVRPAQLPVAQAQVAPQAPSPRQSGPSTAQLMQAASNPFLTEGQRAVVGQMLKQRLEAEQRENDPLRQLQIKKAERDLANDKNPESVREYEYAAKHGFQGSFQDWIANKRAGAGEYGLNGIWGTGPDGKPAIIQLGKSGKPILTPLPEGFQPNKDAQKIDLGTHWGILDPTTRQLVTTLPKDLRGAEREKGIGEQQGKEVAAAPGDIRSGNNALAILDQIKSHEYIDRGTGFTSYGNFIRGTGGYDFENLVQGAKSGAFLQAIQQMRGLGSLSNAEGDAATRAISRMDTATSKDAFLKAVDDYEKIVKQGIARSQARLQNPSSTNPTGGQTVASPADSPSIDDLLKKYGGSK